MGDVWLESRASKSKMSESLDTQAKRKCPATAPEEEARAGHPVMGLDVCVGGGGVVVKHSLCACPCLSLSLELQWGQVRRIRQLEVGAETSKGAWGPRTEVIGCVCVSVWGRGGAAGPREPS